MLTDTCQLVSAIYVPRGALGALNRDGASLEGTPQSMDNTSLSSSQFSISSKALDYQVPAFSYDDLTKSITLTFEQGFYSHDSITLESAKSSNTTYL